MALEIEIKLKVEHLAPVRDQLKQVGATHVGEVMETNIFFDSTDRTLLAQDCGLRLRCNRDLHSKASRLVLTYKGPRGDGPVKSREEIETAVDSEEAATELLSRLGYEAVLTFEKRRETWQIDKVKIELDTMPHLGSFIEIEGATESEVLKVREKLNLKDAAPLMQTYADLVSHHLSDRGDHGNRLTFG